MTALAEFKTHVAAFQRKTRTALNLPGLFQAKFSRPGLILGARMGNAGLVARLLKPQIVRIQKAAPETAEPVNAVVLPKPGFIEDITASIGLDPRFNIYVLRREALKFIAQSFFPDTVDDNTYGIGEPAIESGKPALRALWRDVWRRINADMGLDIVLTGNFSYFAEQELAAAAEADGTAFVALHKENLKTPGLEPMYEDIYRDRKMPFQGSLIATYNEIERGIQARAGTFPADRIKVAGMPRLDQLHHWRERHAGRDVSIDSRPTVLFMSYNEKTGCPFIGRKTAAGQETLADELDAVRWNDLVVQGHRAIAELARRNPDLRVVIKTKDHGWALGALRRGLGESFQPPTNLEIVSGGDPFELIVAADVLAGFNSTSLFEALAANVPIVSLDFAEAADPRFSPYVVDLGEAADRASSPEEFIELLAARARQRSARARRGELGEAQKNMLAHWVGNPDGRSGERVIALVLGHLEARRGVH